MRGTKQQSSDTGPSVSMYSTHVYTCRYLHTISGRPHRVFLCLHGTTGRSLALWRYYQHRRRVYAHTHKDSAYHSERKKNWTSNKRRQSEKRDQYAPLLALGDPVCSSTLRVMGTD